MYVQKIMDRVRLAECPRTKHNKIVPFFPPFSIVFCVHTSPYEMIGDGSSRVLNYKNTKLTTLFITVLDFFRKFVFCLGSDGEVRTRRSSWATEFNLAGKPRTEFDS